MNTTGAPFLHAFFSSHLCYSRACMRGPGGCACARGIRDLMHMRTGPISITTASFPGPVRSVWSVVHGDRWKRTPSMRIRGPPRYPTPPAAGCTNPHVYMPACRAPPHDQHPAVSMCGHAFRVPIQRGTGTGGMRAQTGPPSGFVLVDSFLPWPPC